MNYYVKTFAGIALVLLLAACGQQAPEETAAETAAPTETAEEFVARVNEELKELGRELGAASWVRSTYITEDTATVSYTHLTLPTNREV